MKLQYWVTIAATNALWAPACVWAQGAQGTQGVHQLEGGPTLPIPQPPANRPEGAGNFLPDIDSTIPNRHVPDIDPALPNRRVPSLAPPQPRNVHPVTPDEAWRKPQPPLKPALSSGKSGVGPTLKGDALSGKGGPGIQGPLQGIGGVDSASSTQPLNETGSEGIQHLLRTDK